MKVLGYLLTAAWIVVTVPMLFIPGEGLLERVLVVPLISLPVVVAWAFQRIKAQREHQPH